MGRRDGPTERSIVTVLSADVVGSTRHIATANEDDSANVDDAIAFSDRCFAYLQSIVESAGGRLVSFEGDGSIAIFGWPMALEDHADQACISAWRIQHAASPLKSPRGEDVQFRVGVHSGLVGLRQIRRTGRSRHNAVGPVVNIAAKLQQSARPGTIVVSENVVDLCRSSLELTPHEGPPVEAATLIRAHRLNARPERFEVGRRYRFPIVGRREELSALRSRLPQVGREGASIALIGEAGIGKSRLAAAALSEAASSGARTLVFYGDALKRTTPFAAARALIMERLALSAPLQKDGLEEALAGLSLDAADVSAISALLLGSKVRPRELVAPFTPTQISRALVRAFTSYAPARPTLLVIEDLHLVDPESRQFLYMLARAAKAEPLSLLITARPETLQDAREIADSVLRLEPMQREDMQTFARRLYRGDSVSSPLLDRAVDLADGVPFVLEELVRSLESDEAAALQILPRTVESAIHARLRRLSKGARSVAQALSLLGEDVDIGLIASVTGAGPAELQTDLGELETFAFIHPIAGRTTRLRHQIIAEACANTIPRESRTRLHRAAIASITANSASLAGRHAQLAFHAEGAGDDRAALGFLWEAAVEARGTSAAASLDMIFDRALRVIGRIGAEAERIYVDFVLMVFASMLLLGEFEKMRAHLPRVLALARAQGRADKLSNCQSQLGMLCWFEGRYEEGMRATEEGLAVARELGSAPLIFANQIMLANLLHGMGRIEGALAELGDLCEFLTGDLETARLGAPVIPRSTALSFTGWIMLETGRYLEALEFAQRGLEIALRQRDPYSEVMARNAMGRNLLFLRRHDEAVECLAAAREIAEINGYDAPKANLAGHMATALARTGRAREAIAIAEACMDARLHLRTGQMELFFLKAGYAEALVRAGEAERGLAVLDEAMAIARAVANPCLIAGGLGLRANLLSELAPGDARIGADLCEQEQICRRHGLAPSQGAARWESPRA